MKRFINTAIRFFPALFLIALVAIPTAYGAWTEDQFEKRPLYAFPLPHGKDDIVGNLITYQLQKGDTLLDVGRWFGVTAKEISNANGGLDWWAPPAGRTIILPDEHILPDTPRVGIVMNIPEMRIYYYYPSPTGPIHPQGKSNARQVCTRQEALSRSNAVGGLLVSGRSRPFRLEDAGGKFHGARQDPQSDLGGAAGHLRRASRA